MIEKWINELKKNLGKQKMREYEMNENIFDKPLFEDGQKECVIYSNDDNLKLIIDIDDMSEIELEKTAALLDFMFMLVNKNKKDWDKIVQTIERQFEEKWKKEDED